MDQIENFSIQSIGVMQSPFKQKFGIPRQPGLTPAVRSSIILHAKFSSDDIIDSLQTSSHIWIIFIFSECYDRGWKPKVRPPRLGGNKKIGVFASRSPFRPNPLGMSAVKLLSVNKRQGQIIIDVESADLMNGTPIIDIKPYIPYTDSISTASNDLAESFSPLQQPIFFSIQAQQVCEQYLLKHQQSLSTMIEQVLRCDPRPAYQASTCREYGISLFDLNIRWQIAMDRIDVISIGNSNTEKDIT